MELSRRCLESLNLFRLKEFTDDHTLESFIQGVVAKVLGDDKENDSKQETKENEMIQEALSILFLQAAKRGLSKEELIAYTKQLDWPSEQVSIVSDVYESKYLQMRKSLDSSKPSLPTLVGVKCALVDPSSGIEFEQPAVSFASDKVYYNVIFTYKDVDGSEETISKVLNSIQLNNLITTLQSALSQCDALVSSMEKLE
ncbi:hypothetical protein WA171_005415, partial [Blastocystis sp. BT1]